MIRKRLHRVYSFIRYNRHKRLYLKVLFLSAFYRLFILMFPIKLVNKFMGVINEESKQEESEEAYKKAAVISRAVEQICRITPWESKCLVRALTMQHLLKKNKVSSTLYLGVGKDGEKMIAHAWLRTGKYYISGGCGDGYTLLAKYRA